MFPIVIYTNIWYYRFLPGFAYLFNKYWSAQIPVYVFGHEPLNVELPPNFAFESISPQSLLAESWSTGMIHTLQSMQTSHVILMLEDYWLKEPVNQSCVDDCSSFVVSHDEVLRMDLTGDRLGSGYAFDIGRWNKTDMIETYHDVPYQLSLQAGIWNRRWFLSMLIPQRSPWFFETMLQQSLPKYWRVIGTRQMPVRYVNAWGMGWKGPGPNVAGLPPEDIQALQGLGYAA